jgi:hypothetical protein
MLDAEKAIDRHEMDKRNLQVREKKGKGGEKGRGGGGGRDSEGWIDRAVQYRRENAQPILHVLILLILPITLPPHTDPTRHSVPGASDLPAAHTRTGNAIPAVVQDSAFSSCVHSEIRNQILGQALLLNKAILFLERSVPNNSHFPSVSLPPIIRAPGDVLPREGELPVEEGSSEVPSIPWGQGPGQGPNSGGEDPG